MASAGRVDHVVGLEVGNHVELSAPHVGRSHRAAGAADRHRDVVGRGAAIDLRDHGLTMTIAANPTNAPKRMLCNVTPTPTPTPTATGNPSTSATLE